MTITLFLLLLADVILAATGQLLLTKGMRILGPIDFNLKNVPYLIVQVMQSGYILAAGVCYGFSFIMWLFVLSKVKLSIAYPSLSFVYVLIVFGSWFFFNETVSLLQLIGVVLILLGIFFIFQTH